MLSSPPRPEENTEAPDPCQAQVTDVVSVLVEPSAGGQGVGVCVIRALTDAGKGKVWGPGKCPGAEGRRDSFRPKPWGRRWRGAAPCWTEEFQAGCPEGRLQQKEQHRPSQGGGRGLVGQEKGQDMWIWGVARSSAEEAPGFRFSSWVSTPQGSFNALEMPVRGRAGAVPRGLSQELWPLSIHVSAHPHVHP